MSDSLIASFQASSNSGIRTYYAKNALTNVISRRNVSTDTFNFPDTFTSMPLIAFVYRVFAETSTIIYILSSSNPSFLFVNDIGTGSLTIEMIMTDTKITSTYSNTTMVNEDEIIKADILFLLT